MSIRCRQVEILKPDYLVELYGAEYLWEFDVFDSSEGDASGL